MGMGPKQSSDLAGFSREGYKVLSSGGVNAPPKIFLLFLMQSES